MRRLYVCVCSLMLLMQLGCGGDAHQESFTTLNNTTQAANDLHLTISGSGGSLRDPVLTYEPPGCNRSGTAVIASNRPNEIDVTWPTPCVQPQDTVVVQVTSDFAELGLASVVWTLNGDTIR